MLISKIQPPEWLQAETHPIGHSLSDIRISSKGFEQEFNRTFRNIDPIKEVLIAGLDHDGFDELYIVTVSAGLGSYGSVIGIASIQDERLSMIYFPQIELDDPVFEGYMGHDIFSIEIRRLVRSFPVYQGMDSNLVPTGGIREVIYSLSPGEAVPQLKIESVISAE